MEEREQERTDDDENKRSKSLMPDEHPKLTELLNETRILLPGTQVFLGFLTTLPFASRFNDLDEARRIVFVFTFIANVLALVLFVMPAAYHRVARPIHRKDQFKAFANKFLIAGLVPMSISIVLTTYLVTYMVTAARVASMLAGAIGVLLFVIWWILPLVRAHHYAREAPGSEGRGAGERYARPADGGA